MSSPSDNLIYLDNNATTRMDPRVLEAMLPYFCEKFGNAASRSHKYGWDAEEAVETGRGHVAALIGASAKEIVFTSGATESDNLAIKGTVEMLADKGKHVITCTTEHKAVIDSCKYLESKGAADVTFLDPDKFGRVSREQVEKALRPDTILITLMAANNETGVLQPVAEDLFRGLDSRRVDAGSIRRLGVDHAYREAAVVLKPSADDQHRTSPARLGRHEGQDEPSASRRRHRARLITLVGQELNAARMDTVTSSASVFFTVSLRGPPAASPATTSGLATSRLPVTTSLVPAAVPSGVTSTFASA